MLTLTQLRDSLQKEFLLSFPPLHKIGGGKFIVSVRQTIKSYRNQSERFSSIDESLAENYEAMADKMSAMLHKCGKVF